MDISNNKYKSGAYLMKNKQTKYNIFAFESKWIVYETIKRNRAKWAHTAGYARKHIKFPWEVNLSFDLN